MAEYPEHRVVDVALRDGSSARFRPVRESDTDAVRALFGHISEESSRMRFHGYRALSSIDLAAFVDVDYSDTYGLIAERSTSDGLEVVGLATYVRTDSACAEMAVVVEDGLHGRGIGSLLVEQIADAAAAAGIGRFEAHVLATNNEMLDVLRSLELPVETRLDGEVLHLEFPTSPTEEAIRAFEEREAAAAAAAVGTFLKPRSVAVVGASRRRGTISSEIFTNLLSASFEGPVYPVNPKAEVVQSVRAYPTIADVPEPVDLAVIVVPASAVLEVAEGCGRAGVRALLVISAGFAETGEEGREREKELVDIAVRHGMRIIGPNCMGVMNLDPEVRLNATFSPLSPPAGRLAFSSQSGALGIAVMGRAAELGLGLSSFVSVGNKADVSGNDLLQYWERDDGTDVVLLYLESFGNPRKFARIARRMSETKPIVAVKSGRSEAGARAAASHTASLTSGDVAVDALFRQSGVIRTETLEELFDVASLVSTQPLPEGRRVAILTNAGGLGILCADACEASGLEVAPLSKHTRKRLERFLAAEASVGNPVDMIASASAEDYGRALSVLGADDEIDAVIVIFIPPLVTRAEDVAAALMEAATGCEKTVLSCFLGVHGVHDRLRSEDLVIPSFAFPEPAARALGRVASYASWRARDRGSLPVFDEIDVPGGLALMAGLLQNGERWLMPHEIERVMTHYGIRFPKMEVITAADQAGAAADRIGRPLALKVLSAEIQHKTDVGGVRLGIQPDEAPGAVAEMAGHLAEQGLGDKIEGFLLQEMFEGEGAEMLVGMTLDPSFGPLVTCGAGGVLVELMSDVSVRLSPLTDADAAEMLRELRSFRLLEGYRGSPPLDVAALEELVLRVSQMVEDLPQIAEFDLNPVVVQEEGLVVLDARMRIAHPEPATPRGARRSNR